VQYIGITRLSGVRAVMVIMDTSKGSMFFFNSAILEVGVFYLEGMRCLGQ
jgi:hypothetical protein